MAAPLAVLTAKVFLQIEGGEPTEIGTVDIPLQVSAVQTAWKKPKRDQVAWAD